MSVLGVPERRRELAPVDSRGQWIAWGLALQVVGVGIPTVTAIRRAHEDGLVGGLTHYTVRLVWHEMLRSRADVALIILGVALFVAGAVVLARPFARRVSTLLIAVPLAALVGLAVFGVVALLFAIAFGVIGEGAPDLLTNLWPGELPSRRRRK